MPNDNDLSGRVGLDTTDFKKGVTELNAQMRSIETSFRASATIMGEWGTKSDGLKLRTDSLNEKIDTSETKIKYIGSCL